MNRRELLVRVGGVIVALPATVIVAGCGGDGPADANLGQTSFQTLGSRAAGHAHLLTIQCDILGGGDIRIRTEEAAHHTHDVDFTAAEMATLGEGGTVTKSNAATDTHVHTWTLTKPSNAC